MKTLLILVALLAVCCGGDHRTEPSEKLGPAFSCAPYNAYSDYCSDGRAAYLCGHYACAAIVPTAPPPAGGSEAHPCTKATPC